MVGVLSNSKECWEINCGELTGAFDGLYSTISGAKGSAKGSDSLRFKGP